MLIAAVSVILMALLIFALSIIAYTKVLTARPGLLPLRPDTMPGRAFYYASFPSDEVPVDPSDAGASFISGANQ